MLKFLFSIFQYIFQEQIDNLRRQFSSGKEKEDMSRHSNKRYFINHAEDYNADSYINVDFRNIKKDILSNVYNCAEEQQKTHTGIDGGLYVGTCGNAYTFYHLSKKTRFADEKAQLIKHAVELIKCGVGTAARTKTRDPSDECGFLLGKAGIYALGAAIFFEAGKDDLVADCINHYVNAGSFCAPLSYAAFGGDELFVGRAGYLCGSLWLNRIFGRRVISDDIISTICDAILSSGRKYVETHNSRFPLMFHYYNTEYLGAAHGLCSILQMLLSCDAYLTANKEVERELKHTIDFFMKIQMPNGNFPSSVDEIGVSRGKDELVHWCHGAPGVIYLLLKAYLKWHEPKYLQSAMNCGELVWEKGLLKKGPGICHGVAGSGYVFLALYRVTQDERYLYRANEFAKFLKTEEFKTARVPDNPFSLYEGYAGTICFLADLMEPETSSFPFMEII